MATATSFQLQQLYIGFFGRPADPAGLSYWLSTQVSQEEFSAQMSIQPEYTNSIQGLSINQQIDAMYVKLFGRNAEAAGLAYWTNLFTANPSLITSLPLILINAAAAGSVVGSPTYNVTSVLDNAAITNKATTAGLYTADVLDTSASQLAYNPTSVTPWVTGPQFTSAAAFLTSVTATNIPNAAAVQASVDAMTAITQPGQTFTLTTDRFSYVGGTGNDTFVGGLNSANQQTLLAQDTIVGGGGTNTLIATIVNSVIPASISNIQNVDLTFQGTNASVVNLSNATGIATLTNNGSSGNANVSGLSTSTAVVSQNTATDFNLAFAGVTGTSDSAALTLSGVNGGTTTIASIETLNLTSSGSTTNIMALLDAAQLTTLNVGGTAGLTITGALAAVTSVNQPVGGALSGALKLVFTQGAVTATGGAGNDTFTVNGVGNANLSGGEGNDTFVFAATAFTANDTVTGGDGTADTLQVDAAGAAVANTNITGVEILAVSGAVGATLNTGGVTSGINTVNLLDGTAVASTVTGPAGTLSLNLGTTTNLGVLAGQLTVNDTGVATTDVLNLSNSNAALNAFNGQALVFGGYETANLATGSGSTAQTTGVITLTPDGVGTGVLNISGANGITTGAITATTINASGLTGTAALVMGAGTQTATSITGTANADTLIASAAGTLIEAGAGADSIVGGAGNDTLRGGAGKDTITAGTGNDNIDGGEDNDRILLEGNLTASDTVDGGAGTNTAVITAAVASAAIGARLSNIQILETSDAAQDMSFFANSTITSIAETGGALAVTGASANLNTFNVLAAAPDLINSSFRRATDTSSDALTVSAGGDIGDGSTLAVNDEETITVAAAGNNVDLDLTNAVDLTTLNITASGSAARDLAIVAVGATKLASATFSGINNVSTLLLNAAASGVSFTATVGDFAATIQSGTGADSLTGGVFNDSLEGNNGADTISGGGGNDTLEGGQGVDQISDGTGIDSVIAGTGADIVTLSVDATADRITQGVADSVASTGSNVTAALAAGDTLTYANGVDLINGFLAGATNGDVLLIDSVIAQSILGQTSAGLTSTGYLSGNYNTATGVFTVAGNGAGADTAIVQLGGGINIATNTSIVILRGVNSAKLVNSNFGGSNTASIIPLYGSAGANIFSFQANSFATARIFIAADGTITPGTQNITPNPATGFSQALMVQADFNNLLGGNGVTFNVTGATSTSLTSVLGSSGNDVFILADSDFGAAASTVNGGAGIDTIRFTTYGTDTVGGASAGIVSIENIDLTAGAISLTIDNSVTVASNGSVVAITNSGAASAATVLLGIGAAHTYTSGSTGIDTVSLGLTGQRATLSGGGANDVVVLGTLGSTFISDGTVLTINGAGAAEIDQLAANYTNTGVAASSLVLTAGNGTAAVTTGIMTGFETLDAGDVAVNTAITLNAASTGITTLLGDTTGTQTVTFITSLDQIQGLTTVTNNDAGNTAAFNVTQSATAGGALNLATSALVATRVNALNLASATSVLTLTATGAQVAAFTAGTSAGLVGRAAVGDVLNVTTALTATQLDNVAGFDTFNLSGAANAITTLNGLVATGTAVTVNAAAITGALTFIGDAETNGTFTINGTSANGSIINTGRLIDTVNLGTGTNSLSLGTNELVSAARDVITGFTAGFNASTDVFNIEAAAGGIITGVDLTGTNNFTSAAALQNVAVLGNVTQLGTTEVLNFTQAALNVNFATTTAANFLDGTSLLAAIGGTITGAIGGQNNFLITAADINGNTGIYVAISADSAITANDIHLVGVLSGVAQAGLTVNNFNNLDLI